MSKDLEALETIKDYSYVDDWDNLHLLKKEHKEELDTIEKSLKDYEWLKSIIPIDAMFMWNLSSDDKIKLLEIMGVKL